MRTVGLLGGMSWQSTQIYYKLINEDVQARKGGLHSAPLLIKSFDFAEIETLQASGQWADAGRLLEEQAAALQAHTATPYWQDADVSSEAEAKLSELYAALQAQFPRSEMSRRLPLDFVRSVGAFRAALPASRRHRRCGRHDAP